MWGEVDLTTHGSYLHLRPGSHLSKHTLTKSPIIHLPVDQHPVHPVTTMEEGARVQELPAPPAPFLDSAVNGLYMS